MSTHFLRTALLPGLLLGLLPSCDLGVDGNGNRSVEDRPGRISRASSPARRST